jgi:uncharacterized protein
MRVKKIQIDFLKQMVESVLPNASVFLFGSRVNDNLKGGDIDILVLGERQLTGQEVRGIKIAFYKKFGEQKIDIVSYKREEDSIFKEVAISGAIRI